MQMLRNETKVVVAHCERAQCHFKMVVLWDVSFNSIEINFEKGEHHLAENYS